MGSSTKCHCPERREIPFWVFLCDLCVSAVKVSCSGSPEKDVCNPDFVILSLPQTFAAEIASKRGSFPGLRHSVVEAAAPGNRGR